MNEGNIVENQKGTNETVSSSEASDVEDKEEVQTSELKEDTASDEYTELVEQVTYINQKLDNITNISIVCMVGVGVVIGVICCNIFSRYFKS